MVSQHEPEHQVDPLMRLVQRPSTIVREQLALNPGVHRFGHASVAIKVLPCGRTGCVGTDVLPVDKFCLFGRVHALGHLPAPQTSVAVRTLRHHVLAIHAVSVTRVWDVGEFRRR